MRPKMLIICLLIFVALPLYTVLSGQAPQGRDFRTADRSSAGIAPRAESTPEAVVQVYFARALNWRGIFGVHTWVATNRQTPQSIPCIRSLAGGFIAIYPRWSQRKASRTPVGSVTVRR